MTTAFQPNAFQSNAFQIDGGVAATEFVASISVLQDGDTAGLTVVLPAEALGGWAKFRRRIRIEEPEAPEVVEAQVVEVKAPKKRPTIRVYVDDTETDRATQIEARARQRAIEKRRRTEEELLLLL